MTDDVLRGKLLHGDRMKGMSHKRVTLLHRTQMFDNASSASVCITDFKDALHILVKKVQNSRCAEENEQHQEEQYEEDVQQRAIT